MLIAHEAPMSIMDTVQSLTDYCYCLVHLLEESRCYLDFFKDAKLKRRKIIMDCSLFELGEAFDSKKYYDWLLEIQPDEYIVPDVWQDCDKNLKSFEEFTQNFDLSALQGKKIGVLQGKTWEDFERAYKFMDTNADKIAISFGYDFYVNNWRDLIESKAVCFSEGRKQLVSHLLYKNILNVNKPHHLLGCGVPTEFEFYKNKNFTFIESIDTSHPVLSGFFKKDYDDEETLRSKIPQKMIDIFEEDITSDQEELIIKNIKNFKNICTQK